MRNQERSVALNDTTEPSVGLKALLKPFADMHVSIQEGTSQARLGKGAKMKWGHMIASVVLMMLVHGTGLSADVSWIKGQSPPASWTLSPQTPGLSSVVSFNGPLDQAVYGNSCVAEANLGGAPQLTVDSVNRTIVLWFQGPAPTMCTLIWQPVCGLEGTFGPLQEGKWIFLCQALGVEIPFTVGGAKVTYVDRSATGPSPDGSSWYRAFRNVQDALADATSGGEIRIADGTYKPDRGAGQTPGDREASFDLPDGLILRGGYAGYGAPDPDARDTAIYETILSGDLNDDDLWDILNREDNSYHVVTINGGATLDGLTIANGQADGPYPHHYGGGILVQTGDPIVVDCTLRGNTGVYGGGLAAFSAGSYLANCTLSGNRALLYGGAVYNHESTATLASCLLTGNSAGSNGAGGGAAVCSMGADASHVIVTNCTLADNIGPWPDDYVVFSFNYSSTPSAVEAIRIDNSIVYNDGGAPLIWSNTLSGVAASYSIIQGGWVGTGNLDVDPQFVRRGAWSIEGEWIDDDSNYRLQSTSLGIDHGSNALVGADRADVDGDEDTSESHPLDLAGADRVQGGRVDAGAYERSAVGPKPEPDWQTLRTFEITLDVPAGITYPVTLNGAYSHQIETNFIAELKLEIEATSAAGGTWTAWFDPDPGAVGPGTTTVTWRVRGENVAVGALTPGAMDVTVAEVTLSVRPAL